MSYRYAYKNDPNKCKEQLDSWITEYALMSPSQQNFVDMRDLIYKIEQMYEEEYTDKNGNTETRVSKEGQNKINNLKKSHKATHEQNVYWVQTYLQTYELKKTHLPLLEELGFDRKDLDLWYGRQPTTWKMRWEQYKWRWEVLNPETEKWEIATWKTTQNPERETVVRAWMNAKSQSDIGRRFNWTESQVSNSTATINNWLQEVGLQGLPELPKYNNEELENRRLLKLTNTDRNKDKHNKEVERLRKLLLQRGAKIMGTTSK